MTQIILMTSDQHLFATQKVKIAAGDINSVVLRVEFDSAWDDFTERKAVFSNDSVNGGETQDMLLIGNECIVPNEQLSKDGMLSISVKGYGADGTTKKTSTIVKMKVHASLVDSSKTLTPTMDLYMQYLSALDEKLNPVTEKVNKALEEQKAEHAEMLENKMKAITTLIEEQRTWMQGVELWVNPDPSASIGDNGLTIEVDRTQYPRLHVEVLSETTETPEAANEIHRDCLCVHSNGGYVAGAMGGTSTRRITVFDDRITIGACSHSASNTIPYKIIGYKY